MVRARDNELLLGEWACLGVLAERQAHGFAIAKRLAPTGDIGRVWSLSRPLTYRALDQLLSRGLIRAVSEERGTAGGNRTIYGVTRSGRAALRQWLATPAPHLRDVRSELLLKLLLCERAAIDPTPLIDAQRELSEPVARRWATEARQHPGDPVTIWRHESSKAVVRFLNRLTDAVATATPDAAELNL